MILIMSNQRGLLGILNLSFFLTIFTMFHSTELSIILQTQYVVISSSGVSGKALQMNSSAYLEPSYPPVQRPKPAPDVQDPKGHHPASSDLDGSPPDYLSGMSKSGWKLAQETHQMILAAAAKAGNTTGDGAHVVYDKQRLYVESLWFSVNRKFIPTDNPEDIWMRPDIFNDEPQIMISKTLQKMIDGITDSEKNDYSAYITMTDQLAYNVHYQLEKRKSRGAPVTKIGLNAFWASSVARIFMGDYFLGHKFTKDRRETYSYAIFFINSMNWHFLNLYEIGCKARPAMEDFTLSKNARAL